MSVPKTSELPGLLSLIHIAGSSASPFLGTCGVSVTENTVPEFTLIVIINIVNKELANRKLKPLTEFILGVCIYYSPNMFTKLTISFASSFGFSIAAK